MDSICRRPPEYTERTYTGTKLPDAVVGGSFRDSQDHDGYIFTASRDPGFWSILESQRRLLDKADKMAITYSNWTVSTTLFQLLRIAPNCKQIKISLDYCSLEDICNSSASVSLPKLQALSIRFDRSTRHSSAGKHLFYERFCDLHITKLELSRIRLHTKTLKGLFPPTLTSVSLHKYTERETDVVLGQVDQAKLTELGFSHCEIGELHLPNVSTLNLTHLSLANSVRALRGCPNVEVLVLKDFTLPLFMSRHQLIKTIATCTHLRVLKVLKVPWFGDSSLRELTNLLKYGLDELVLTEGHGMSEDRLIGNAKIGQISVVSETSDEDGHYLRLYTLKEENSKEKEAMQDSEPPKYVQ